MFEGFNHKKEVERRFRQLDNLNNVIEERTAECRELGVELQKLKTKIDAILSKYPNINIDEALEQYHLDLFEENRNLESANASLVAEINTNKAKLAELQEKLKIAYGLEEIALEKQTLEEARNNLNDYKEKYKASDCVIASYMIDNFPVTNTFIYLGDTTYIDNKSKKEYPARYYQSLDKSRIIGLSNDLSYALKKQKKEIDGYAINTYAEFYMRFADAYYYIKGEIYGKNEISKGELIDFVNEFIKETTITMVDGKMIIKRKEKGKSR